MVTSSFGPGTVPVLQLLATSQKPLASTFQETRAGASRSSSRSRHGRLGQGFRRAGFEDEGDRFPDRRMTVRNMGQPFGKQASEFEK
jgi:hypothetical protein